MTPPPPGPQFSAGQVWRYWTRPGEEESRAIVGKVETLEDGRSIVHVKVTGVRMVDPRAPGGFWPTLSHAPVAEEAFAESVTELTSDLPDLAEFDDGYRVWLENHGGVFTISLAELLGDTEEALG